MAEFFFLPSHIPPNFFSPPLSSLQYVMNCIDLCPVSRLAFGCHQSMLWRWLLLWIAGMNPEGWLRGKGREDSQNPCIPFFYLVVVSLSLICFTQNLVAGFLSTLYRASSGALNPYKVFPGALYPHRVLQGTRHPFVPFLICTALYCCTGREISTFFRLHVPAPP